jgi:hypothetical protein
VINGVATLTPDSPTDVLNISAGEGITLSADVANDLYTITAKYGTALWNANKLQGYDIATSAPSSGQVLKWNGSAWAPGTDADTDTNTTYSAALPITLTGTEFGLNYDNLTLKADGVGNYLYANSSSALWNANKVRSIPITTATPAAGTYAYYDGTNLVWAAPTPQPTVSGGSGDDDFISGTPTPVYNSSNVNYAGGPINFTSTSNGNLINLSTDSHIGHTGAVAQAFLEMAGKNGIKLNIDEDGNGSGDHVEIVRNGAAVASIDDSNVWHANELSAGVALRSQNTIGWNGVLTFTVPYESGGAQIWGTVRLTITGGIITAITTAQGSGPTPVAVQTPLPSAVYPTPLGY